MITGDVRVDPRATTCLAGARRITYSRVVVEGDEVPAKDRSAGGSLIYAPRAEPKSREHPPATIAVASTMPTCGYE